MHRERRLFLSEQPRPRDIFCRDMALVCQIDAALEALDRGQLLRMDQGAVVQHDGIQRKARLKAADLSEERTAAARGQIERLRDRQGRSGVVEQTPAELRDADGLRHDAEQILRLSGGRSEPRPTRRPRAR